MNILQITYANQQPQTLAYKTFKNADEAFKNISEAKLYNAKTVAVSDDFDRKMLVDPSAVISMLITSMENEQRTAQAIQAATPRGLVPAGGQPIRYNTQ